MNIPKDIVEKYNFLKQQTYESLGLVFNPGVSTYQAPVPSSHNPNTDSYNSQNYSSMKSKDQSLQISQIEEILKSFSEHLSNMTKGIILEEESSFIQESLSKKFLEPLSKKDYFYTNVPKDFLQRVDIIKIDFDRDIKKLIDHFGRQKEEMQVQSERKIELLKQEANKYKGEIVNVKNQMERQCRCKYFEETLEQMSQDHQKQIDRVKQKYESEIYDLRTKANQSLNIDYFRERIFTDISERVFAFLQDRHNAYLQTYCQDHNLTDPIRQADPVDLVLYVCQRLSSDNNWLVDKLAELQSECQKLQDIQSNNLDSQLLLELSEQAKLSTEILDNFNFTRNEFLAQLEGNGTGTDRQGYGSLGKENFNEKKHSYNSVRDSIQSARSFNKSLSNRNINQKHQLLPKMIDNTEYEDQNESLEKRQTFADTTREYYNNNQ